MLVIRNAGQFDATFKLGKHMFVQNKTTQLRKVTFFYLLNHKKGNLESQKYNQRGELKELTKQDNTSQINP